MGGSAAKGTPAGTGSVGCSNAGWDDSAKARGVVERVGSRNLCIEVAAGLEAAAPAGSRGSCLEVVALAEAVFGAWVLVRQKGEMVEDAVRSMGVAEDEESWWSLGSIPGLPCWFEIVSDVDSD